jgi:murein DD-endopeptidase MepM/ murein hydrolase activator NlpD
MTRAILLLFGILILAGFAMPETKRFPVHGGGTKDFNKGSFWHHPWGVSGVHKGIDIFGRTGTPILSATPGIVVYSGELGRGGNVVIVLGSKWRLHYYAHLETVSASGGGMVSAGTRIGTLGDSGNAKGKPPHLHYTILALLPHVWRYDGAAVQGWKKMFFLDPGVFLQPATQISG